MKGQPTTLDGFGVVHCGRCGRTLRDPVSRIKGMGPVCRGKIRFAQREGNDTGIDPWDAETMNITFRRKKGLGITNVPQIHKHHSPSGTEWGYHGSGAADLALNILARFLPLARAGKMGHKANRMKLWGGSEISGRVWELHQDFKREFIATMPYHGGTIEGVRVVDWLIEQGTPRSEISTTEQTAMV
jgi:hypothetical protein